MSQSMKAISPQSSTVESQGNKQFVITISHLQTKKKQLCGDLSLNVAFALSTGV